MALWGHEWAVVAAWARYLYEAQQDADRAEATGDRYMLPGEIELLKGLSLAVYGHRPDADAVTDSKARRRLIAEAAEMIRRSRA